MTTEPLFGGPSDPAAERTNRTSGVADVLITVKAAPNPSSTYGETVCVAGIRVDALHPGWIRLYPINFRELGSAAKFKKYDVIRLPVSPATNDSRLESWRPSLDSSEHVTHLTAWQPRIPYIEPWISGNACDLISAARTDPAAPSLALIRPLIIHGIDIQPHPGWSPSEQRKIDTYVNQLSLFGTQDRSVLEPPRFTAAYRYQCENKHCTGHRQTLIDWELVAFQRGACRNLNDTNTKEAIRAKFYEELCAPDRDTCFYLGNQAKRRQTFSILGVWWPPTK